MSSHEQTLQEFLSKNDSTKYIRFQWTDFSGILRVRFVPIERCLRIAKGDEVYIVPQVSMIIPVSTAPRSFPTSNEIETWFLRPDWSSLRPCGFRLSHATVMCFMAHKEPQGSDNNNKCPRALLSDTLARLKNDQGDCKVLAGFEIEVMILGHDSQPLQQLDRLNSYQTAAGLRGQTLDIVEEVVDCLKNSSIDIQHFHTETYDQIEFAFSPESPLNAVDSFVLAQETIRTVFTRNNIKATMTPKPLLNGPTNGVHLHMSLDKLESPRADNFLAGILEHVSSLCAFGMANHDGYIRTVNDAAGSWIGFGTENRDLPIRKISEQHWEMRMMDVTSNPYLFTAAVLLAGLDGLRNATNLSWKDCNVFPHSLNDSSRAEYRLDRRMPTSLQDALKSLKTDDTLMGLFPEGLVDSYISVKEKEVEGFSDMPEEERRLKFVEYF